MTAKEFVENALPVHAIKFMLLNVFKNRSKEKPKSPASHPEQVLSVKAHKVAGQMSNYP